MLPSPSQTHWSSGDSESTLADVCGSARRLSDDSQVTCVTLAATPDAPSAGEGPDAKQDAAWWQARELQASWPRRRSASEPVARSASPAAARPDEGGRRGDDATAADARTTPAAAAPPGGGEGRQRVSCRHHRVLCCLLRQIPAVDQVCDGRRSEVRGQGQGHAFGRLSPAARAAWDCGDSASVVG